MKKFAAYLTASWFGLGFSPKASGTFGSLGALPLVWALAFYTSLPIMLAVAAVLFFVGVWATHQIIKRQENKDPSLVVIDEVVGQMLSFSLVWQHLSDWKIYILGFALFRFLTFAKWGRLNSSTAGFTMPGALCWMTFSPALPPPLFCI